MTALRNMMLLFDVGKRGISIVKELIVRACLMIAMMTGLSEADAQVNAGISDGENKLFAEGVLTGHVVQDAGTFICDNPFVIGRYISCAPRISVQGNVFEAPDSRPVWLTTSGVLGGYAVIDVDGRIVCEDPVGYPQFRGPTSYITCN